MVTVYSKNNCGACVATKSSMSRKGIEYAEVNVSDHPEFIPDLIAKGFSAMPVVVPHDGEAWSGYRPDRIKELVA